MRQKYLGNYQEELMYKGHIFYLFLPNFLSIWHVYFPFPVLNGAENNTVGFALKENDSFSCVQHLVSQRCVYLSNGTVVWDFGLFFILL